MTGFFSGQAGGGAPVASWKARGIGDGIGGEITDLSYVPKKKYNSEEVELDPAGNRVQQLRVTIQAQPDNYATAAKQLIDDETKMVIPDDGKRAIYIARDTNISFATARALAVHQLDDLQVGGTYAVQLKGEIDTGKGNPAKDHEVWYTPPAQGAGFSQFQAAPQQQPQQPQQPVYQQPQAAPQQAFQPAAPQQAPQPVYQQPAPQQAPQPVYQQPAPQQAPQPVYQQPQAAPQQAFQPAAPQQPVYQQPAPQQAFQQPQAAPQAAPQQSYQQQIQNAPQVPAPAGQTLFADQPPF